jgi:hypothetical protein
VWDVKDAPHLSKVIHFPFPLPPLPSSPSSIQSTSQRHLWIPTSAGVFVCDTVAGSTHRISTSSATAVLPLEDLEVTWVGTLRSIEIYDLRHFRLLAVMNLPACCRVFSLLRTRDGSVWARVILPTSTGHNDPPGFTFADAIVIFRVFRTFEIDMSFLCDNIPTVPAESSILGQHSLPGWRGYAFAPIRGGGHPLFVLSNSGVEKRSDTQIFNSLTPLIEVGRDVWSLDPSGRRVTVWRYDETEQKDSYFGGFEYRPVIREAVDLLNSGSDVRVSQLSVIGKEIWLGLSDRTVLIWHWPLKTPIASLNGFFFSFLFLPYTSQPPSSSPSLQVSS